MKVLVVDGQGGKIGKTIVEKLIEKKCGLKIIAVGTNTAATAAMIKAGATQGATGENPVVINAADADIIVGPIGLIVANSLLGEITPRIALAVSKSRAQKVLIPVNKCNVFIAGTQELALSDYIQHAVDEICKMAQP